MHPDETDHTAAADLPSQTRSEPAFPPRVRLLWVGSREPVWIHLTLQLDSAGCHEPQLAWVSTSSEALTLLREESFDCLLIAATATAGSPPVELDLVRAIRASGCDDPLVVVCSQADDDWLPGLYECGGEILVSPRLWDSVALLPTIRRAMARVELTRENHHLAVANYRRLVRERDEAEQLLRQQRQMIQDLQALPGLAEPTDEAAPPPPWPRETPPLPPPINDYYHELLRTYVIIGSGSLSTEIARLAEILAVAGLSPREALQLHVERVEALVRGLGSRSSRHVMTRADLLALELMIHLGECYQKQWPARAADAGGLADPEDG